MSEESQAGVEAGTAISEVAPVELSSMERRAVEMGWRPKEEFNGDEDDFIDAKEFVRRQPLFDKISQQGQTLRKVNESLIEMKQHYAKVEQAAYERAIKELKTEQKAAIAEGDLQKYHELQENIEEQRVQQDEALKVAQEAVAQQSGTAHPEFQAWQSRNPWYAQNNHMKVFADEEGLKLARQGMNPAEVLKAVEKAVRDEFPNKFRNVNKDSAPQLESSSASKVANRSGGKAYSLSDSERKIMRTIVSTGIITEAQYIADLRKIKGE